MDATALVAFLFKAPPNVRTVELLGSWDNFTQPYVMHHDRRRGQGAWSGCFKFENIIFDGDQVSMNRPRSGGLKQGGTYWYYYRLDYDVEAYDDTKEWTTACPLIPGQRVNVMEVPVEVVQPPSRCQSACFENGTVEGTLGSLKSLPRYALTMNPQDKFAAPEPPPLCKVHWRCVSDLALSGRLENSVPIKSPISASSVHAEAPSNEVRSGTRGSTSSKPFCSISSYSRRSWHSEISDESGSPSKDIRFPWIDHPDPLSSSPIHGDGHKHLGDGMQNGNDLVTFRSMSAGICDDNNEIVNLDTGRSINSRPTTSYSISRQSVRDSSGLLSGDTCQYWSQEAGNIPQASAANGSTPFTDRGFLNDDFCSPTFSAVTVSSNGGINTPFRLSAGYSHTVAADIYDQQALDDVVQRLRSLHTASDSTLVEGQSENVSGSEFASYPVSLPPTMESTRSFGKLTPPRSGNINHDISVPSLLPEINTGSIVDHIFTELGYLRTSIT